MHRTSYISYVFINILYIYLKIYIYITLNIYRKYVFNIFLAIFILGELAPSALLFIVIIISHKIINFMVYFILRELYIVFFADIF